MNKRIKIAAIAVAATAVIAGGTTAGLVLTSGGTPRPVVTQQVAADTAPVDTAPDITQLANSIGATQLTAIDPTLYASSEATAMWHGQPVDITTFSSQQLRDQWLSIAQQYVPIITVGPSWVIAGN